MTQPNPNPGSDGPQSGEPTHPLLTPPADAQQSTTPPPADKPNDGDVPPEVKRALNKANKEAEDLRKKLKAFEDKDKTELEKLREQFEAAQFEASKNAKELLRAQVARKHQLTDDLVEFLSGDTEEELEAKATKLAELSTARRGPDRRPDPSQGNANGGGALPLNGDPILDTLKEKLGIV